MGIGLGLASPGLQTSGVGAVESDQAGSAAGLYSTSRYLGSIIGSAVIAGILGASDMDVDGLGLVFLLSFIAAVVAAVVSLGLRGRTVETPDYRRGVSSTPETKKPGFLKPGFLLKLHLLSRRGGV